jgi:hypothetical protein
MLLALARCLHLRLIEGPSVDGEMEQTNLAAAILRCVSSGPVHAQLEQGEHLTNETAINLADWLRCEPPINAWRRLYLTQTSDSLREGDQTPLPGEN